MTLKALIAFIICTAVAGCRPHAKHVEVSKMQNPVNYFEIPVSDLERSIRFYESVFECKLERKTIDGNEMAIFPGSLDGPGIFGALAYGSSYKPSLDGTRIYFAAENIDAVLARVLKNGGRVEYPKTDIGQVGFVAEFIDTEGNRLALHEPPAQP